MVWGKSPRPGHLCAVLRGGNWNDNSNAGVFAANLNNGPTNANNNIGFRCAFSQLLDSGL
jgi:formylglycine-generating enzyme required for sulfatase activity